MNWFPQLGQDMSDVSRVEEIFLNAVSRKDPAERVHFLDVQCGPDAELRRRVEVLLAAQPNVGGFLESPADLTGAYQPKPTKPEATAAVGDRIGPYKLLEKIGEGGMGEVWVADQLEPIKRRVAVKLIKPGMDSRSVLGRFEAERQALAVMDHPNIAKVLDAGTSADGRPYFVMELVKGTPITEFADARKLTPKQRLELFIPVCQAIQHAHMKGIIHRDIKPSNVLVALHDETPVPKVIDFGVAKAVGQQLTENTIYTGFGALVGTPTYMAPEQATFNQLDVDTRADVYALGVLLYELLAGSPPIEKERLKKAALDEVLRIVREEEPPRPSARLSTSQAKASIAATRGSEPAKLSALMKGELDWIVMKALEKDRTRRYETANGFAADVQRYLSGEQVQAVPPSFGYRLRKVYRRYRAEFVTSGAFLAVLIMATIVSLIHATRASLAERDAILSGLKAEQARDAAREAQIQADLARQEAVRNAQKIAIDLDLKYWDVEQARGLLRLAQRLKSLPPAATDLREFVTLNLFVLGQRLGRLVPYQQPLTGISPDGRIGFRLISNGVADLCHPLTGQRLALLADNALSGTDFRFSTDGRLGVLVLAEEVKVYDLRTFERRAVLRPNVGAGWQVVLNSSCERAVVWREQLTGTDKSTVRVEFKLWDVGANKQLANLNHAEWPVNGPCRSVRDLIVFNPDGRELLTVAGDRIACVWSSMDGRLLHSLKGHTMDVRFAAISSDGQFAATGSQHEVLWWSTGTWRQDGPPTRQIIESKWNIDGRPDPNLWPRARFLYEGVLAVAVRNSDDNRDGSTDYIYVRGEPTAHLGRGMASDGRVSIDSDSVFSLRPFGEWQPTNGRSYPSDFKSSGADRCFMLLHSDLIPFSASDRLIDIACDRPVGGYYVGLVPCAIPGCRFMAINEWARGWGTSQSTVVLPADLTHFNPDTLELWAKVLTCGELNPVSGFFVPHDEATWERNRQELLRTAKPVGEFPFPGAFTRDRMHWLRKQNDLSDRKWLDRLVAEEPTAENLRSRANFLSTYQRRYDLALQDELAAEEMDRMSGVKMPYDNTLNQADKLVYVPNGSRESYELALRWLDTRSNRNQFRSLRGLALYRLGRHQEALDLLLIDEREQANLHAAVGGGMVVLQANDQRTLTIGLCLRALGKSKEALSRLSQARNEHRLRASAGAWPHSVSDTDRAFFIEAEGEIMKDYVFPEPKK